MSDRSRPSAQPSSRPPVDPPGHGQGGASPLRALAWVGIGVFVALAAAVVLTPAGVVDLATIGPLLLVIVAGTIVTLVAGARGRRADRDRRLLAQLDDQDRAGLPEEGQD